MNNKDRKRISSLFNSGIILVLLILVMTVIPRINYKEGLLNDISGSTNQIAAVDSTTTTVWTLNCSCDCDANTDSIARRNCILELGDGLSGTYSDYNQAVFDAAIYANDCALRTPSGIQAYCEPVPVQQQVFSEDIGIKLSVSPAPTGSKTNSKTKYYNKMQKITITAILVGSDGRDISSSFPELLKADKLGWSLPSGCTIDKGDNAKVICDFNGYEADKKTKIALGPKSVSASVDNYGEKYTASVSFSIISPIDFSGATVLMNKGWKGSKWVVSGPSSWTAVAVTTTFDLLKGTISYAQLKVNDPCAFDNNGNIPASCFDSSGYPKPSASGEGFANGGVVWYTETKDTTKILYNSAENKKEIEDQVNQLLLKACGSGCTLVDTGGAVNNGLRRVAVGNELPALVSEGSDQPLRSYFKIINNGTVSMCATSDIEGSNDKACAYVTVSDSGSTDPKDPSTPVTPVDPSNPEVGVMIKSVGIASSNANRSIAKLNDTITLNITTNASTVKPTVVIGGVNATVSGTGTKFTATAKVTSAMPDGTVAFTVTLKNGSKGSNTTDGSYVNIYKTGFGLSSVTIQSNNYKHNVAYEGQTVTIKMVATEDLKKAPNVSIGGIIAKVYGSGKEYTAYITTTSAMKAGTLSIKISGYTNAGGTVGNTMTATTDGSSVIFIKTSTSSGVSNGGSTKKVNVSSAALNKSIIYLKPNEEEQLTVAILPIDATNKTVNWKSLDSKVATVSTTGLVKAKTSGKTEISVTTADGGFISKTYVVVSNEEYNYSADSSLTDLKIKGYTLDFKPADHSYTITVKSNVSSLDITPVLNDSKATYKIMGNSNLSNGSTVKVIVTAEDYSTTTYTVKINKKAKANVGLIVGIIVGILLLGGAGYYFYKKRKQNTSF